MTPSGARGEASRRGPATQLGVWSGYSASTTGTVVGSPEPLSTTEP